MLKGKKKVSAFIPVKSFMIQGKDVGCSSDHINIVLDEALGATLAYEVFPFTQSLDFIRVSFYLLFMIQPRGGSR